MRSLRLLSSLLLALPAARASVIRNDAYTLFEKLDKVPHGWTEESSGLAPSEPITLRFHVKQQNVEAFEQKLLDVRKSIVTAAFTNRCRSLRLATQSMATT